MSTEPTPTTLPTDPKVTASAENIPMTDPAEHHHPAYPVMVPGGAQNPPVHIPGLTLHDHFYGLAMNGYLAGRPEEFQHSVDTLVAKSRAVADAMMKNRDYRLPVSATPADK